MGKKDLGEVKTTTRIRNGVKQEIRLFNKRQRQIVKEEVKNRPDGKTIEDILKIYAVSPAVYYSWLRSEPEEVKENEDKLPNPLEDSLGYEKDFASDSELRSFYEAKSSELKAFIRMKFEEWAKTDLISQINKKITPENISEVAKAGNITVDELKSFLQRKNMELTFYSVEAIRRYLQI